MRLTKTLLFLLILWPGSARGERIFRFDVPIASDLLISFQARSKSGTWRDGTAPVLTIASGSSRQNIVLIHAPEWFEYSCFIPATDGSVQVAADTDFELKEFRDQPSAGEVLRYAPILVSRNEPGISQNDLPLIVYCEVAQKPKRLAYTWIFSNEDAGTDTEALFARWGRATDIELVYVREWSADGFVRETIQTYDHKIVPFAGKKEGDHPVIYVATKNNVFDSEGSGPLRFNIPPHAYNSFERTRESVMDEYPWTYRVMAEELVREKKLFDPRQFVYVDFKAEVAKGASVYAGLRFQSGEETTSDRGNPKNRVSRSAWIRIAIPIPSQADASHIDSVFFACDRPDACKVTAISQTELLDASYRPVKIPVGYLFRY
ncbi:MAG TPA: hypothetical protein VGL91_01265 [Acidobacteriota bacterium]|jgi:hypothetical protein